MERGWWCYKKKNDPELEVVLAWEQVRETEVRSWLPRMPWRAQGVKSWLSSPEARTREPCLLASERDAKKRSSLWHLYSSEHSQAESLEDHKQHKALMDMLGCVEAELTPVLSHWLPWYMARVRTSQLPLLHSRHPKQRGSALPHTQRLAVQANHTLKCPQPWTIPFPPQNPGRFCYSCCDVSWKATLHLTLHIGLVNWELQISKIYSAEKFSKLDVCRDGRRLQERCFLSLMISGLILCCRDHAGVNRSASSVQQPHY